MTLFAFTPLFTSFQYYVDPMGNLALSKVNLLNKVMAGIVRAIHRESDDRKLINPRPYFRLLLNLVVELTAPDPGFDASSYQVTLQAGSA